MKLKNIVKPVFIPILIAPFFGASQTSNFGEVSIHPGAQMSIVGDFNNTTAGSVMNDGELYVYSDFNNNGMFSYITGGDWNITHFQGTDVQRITGSQLSEFYNVRFNNPSAQTAFELSGDISIVNQVEFNRGIVQNDDFGGSITFEQWADHIDTSHDSHVDGRVQKNGDTAFEFPIGDGSFYREARITAPDAINDVFTSKYVLENSNTVYPHKLARGVIELIDDTEYWILHRDQGTSNIALTLSWDEDTTPSEIISGNTSAIHIVRWDETQGFWIDEGGIVDEASQMVTTITEVSGYGVFTLARVKEELILPGNLVIYNAVTPDNNDLNDFFHIEGIAQYPNNTVQIFNRWGGKVFETTGYNESDNVFRGFSDGRLTLKRGNLLPAGTYFYILNYEYDDGTDPKSITRSGYLYINEN